MQRTAPRPALGIPHTLPAEQAGFRASAAIFGMVAALPMHVNGAYRASVLPLGKPLGKK